VARFLAIDWDETECRYAVATLQNEKIAVRDAGIVPIDTEEFDSPLDALAMAVHSLGKEEKIGSCPLLISLGRSDVEWLQQKLPPCKEMEIPLLLKNQVLREISGSTEADPIDYMVFESLAEGHRVLALTISQTFRKSLLRTFRSLGYPPMRIGFRAANAAELVLHNLTQIHEEEDENPDEPHLVVSTVGNDVDLIIIAERRIAAVRSFRLPAEYQQKNLAEEIERTLTIGLEGDNPAPIRHLIVFGEEMNVELLHYFSKSDWTIRFLNPFNLPSVSTASTSKSVNDPAKFAPLLGSLLLQSQKIKPAIDFLRPKEAPKPPDYTRPALLALALLAVISCGLYFWNQWVINGMEAKLAALTKEYQQVSAEYNQIHPGWNVLRQTQAWEYQNVVWLDVLKDLSEVMPSSTDLVVAQMTLSGPVGNDPRVSGTISLSGMVRNPSVLMKLQSDLHGSGRYLYQHQAPSPNPAGGGYPWTFRTTIYRLRRVRKSSTAQARRVLTICTNHRDF